MIVVPLGEFGVRKGIVEPGENISVGNAGHAAGREGSLIAMIGGGVHVQPIGNRIRAVGRLATPLPVTYALPLNAAEPLPICAAVVAVAPWLRHGRAPSAIHSSWTGSSLLHVKEKFAARSPRVATPLTSSPTFATIDARPNRSVCRSAENG